jgi:hypothetical protein
MNLIYSDIAYLPAYRIFNDIPIRILNKILKSGFRVKLLADLILKIKINYYIIITQCQRYLDIQKVKTGFL